MAAESYERWQRKCIHNHSWLGRAHNCLYRCKFDSHVFYEIDTGTYTIVLQIFIVQPTNIISTYPRKWYTYVCATNIWTLH